MFEAIIERALALLNEGEACRNEQRFAL